MVEQASCSTQLETGVVDVRVPAFAHRRSKAVLIDLGPAGVAGPDQGSWV